MKPDDVTAVVLAAGTSSRMWPLHDKHLLRFAGRLLIEVHLERLLAAGVRRLVLVGNADNLDPLREAAADASADAEVVAQTAAPGMAGGVLSAVERLGEDGLARPIYVTQPHDVMEDGFHRRMIEGATGAYGYLAAYVTDGHFPGGYLVLDGERAVGIVEKPARGQEPSNLVTIVAHLFADGRALVRGLERQSREHDGDDAYERALARIMAEQPVKAVPYRGAWQPLKYPWHVLDVMGLLLEQMASGALPPAAGYRQVAPGVFLGGEVQVHPGAHLVAPVAVGHRVVVGHNALVRGSMVGDGCVVGYGTEVARSWLGEGCQLHGNYVGDSVLERDVLLGFGTITANFRLDGRTVRSTVRGERVDSEREKLGMVAGAGAKLGVGVNVMPGVKIGARAVVRPGLTIVEDVPDGAEVRAGGGGDGGQA